MKRNDWSKYDNTTALVIKLLSDFDRVRVFLRRNLKYLTHGNTALYIDEH